MERMKKRKKKSGCAHFCALLLKLVAAVLLAFLLWLLQITVSVGTGLILPANAAEKEALAYLHTIGAHTDIVSSGIPSACGYAIYDASGELLETDMSGSIRENADLLALSGQDSSPQICSDEPMLNARPTPGLWCSLMISGLPLQIHAPASLSERRTAGSVSPAVPASCSFCTRHHTAGKIPVAGTFSSAGSRRRNPQSESRLYHPADCHLRIQPGSRFFGRALKSELSASLKEQWHMQQQRRRQFSALAHDIKTPLTIVRGNAELLSETALDETQQSCNRFILENAAQIQDYLSRIIELAKTDDPAACSAECRFRRSFTRHRFSTICSGIQKSRSEKRTACSFSTETLPAVLPLPEHPLRRILNNLLDNAVCYSPHKGTVTLDASIRDYRDAPEKESTLFLTVSDEGPGFCEDALLYGTEAFYRESADRNDKKPLRSRALHRRPARPRTWRIDRSV